LTIASPLTLPMLVLSLLAVSRVCGWWLVVGLLGWVAGLLLTLLLGPLSTPGRCWI
jgi:thiosulfate reductase cytochrome b subunit